jgi:hypothetical protein
VPSEKYLKALEAVAALPTQDPYDPDVYAANSDYDEDAIHAEHRRVAVALQSLSERFAMHAKRDPSHVVKVLQEALAKIESPIAARDTVLLNIDAAIVICSTGGPNPEGLCGWIDNMLVAPHLPPELRRTSPFPDDMLAAAATVFETWATNHGKYAALNKLLAYWQLDVSDDLVGDVTKHHPLQRELQRAKQRRS